MSAKPLPYFTYLGTEFAVADQENNLGAIGR